jgi:hypothetical protein
MLFKGAFPFEYHGLIHEFQDRDRYLTGGGGAILLQAGQMGFLRNHQYLMIS